MNDVVHVLHNMSVPPATVVQYEGLSKATSRWSCRDGAMTRCIVAFRAPELKRTPSATSILRLLGVSASGDPSDLLTALIESRASELPLPDGALLVKHRPEHTCIWPDLLSFLTVATKSTGHVWLRSKQPSLSRLTTMQSVSVVVPPAFADRIREETS